MVRIDVALADAPRDDLRVLRPEIQNDDLFVHEIKNRNALFACARRFWRAKNVFARRAGLPACRRGQLCIATSARFSYKLNMKAFGQSGRMQANGFRAVHHTRCPAQAGFSLVELLITLALMLIMTTMMWGFGSASRQRAEKKACQQNLSKIYLAMQIYANDYAGKLPETTNARTSEEALDVAGAALHGGHVHFHLPGRAGIRRCRRASRFANERSAMPITWARI